jgi:hypothetical protein
MNEPVAEVPRPVFAFRAQLELAEWFAFARAVDRASFRTKHFSVSYFVLLILVVLLWIGSSREGGMLLLAVVTAHAFLTLPGSVQPQSERRRVEAMLVETETSILDSGVRVESELNVIQHDWRAVRILVDAREGFMFADAKCGPLVWVPRRAHFDEHVQRSVIAFAQRRGVRSCIRLK